MLYGRHGVCLLRWVFNATEANSNSVNFGSGFDLMKAGNDTNSLWTQSCVRAVRTLCVNFSIGAVLSHVPYTLPVSVLTTIARNKSVLVRLRAFCKERIQASPWTARVAPSQRRALGRGTELCLVRRKMRAGGQQGSPSLVKVQL